MSGFRDLYRTYERTYEGYTISPNRSAGTKKANFRGLIAKICHLRPILASRTHPCYMFMNYAIEIVP